MSQGQPWSPFPVQDWSSLPEDPLAPARSVPVEVASTTPSRHRRRWPPWVILLTVAVLITGVNAVVLRPDPPNQLAARFAPEDGSAAYQQTVTTRGSATTTATTAVESGRFVGLSGILSVDSTLSARALAALDPDHYETVHLWRTTSTSIAQPTGRPEQQTTALYRVDNAVELLAMTSVSEGAVYVPALPVLPADVANGSRWTAAGSAGDELDYRAEFTAESAQSGCLLTRGTIKYTDRINEGPGQTKVVEDTWCTGRGLVSSTVSLDNESRVMTEVEAPTSDPPNTRDAVADDRPEPGWKAQPISMRSVNPQFGEGVMNGNTTARPAPVSLASGLIIRPGSSPADLIGVRIEPGGASAVPVWRGHPGGTILSLASFGDVVVTTTSDRRMLAYDARGVRQWAKSFDDLAPTAPVRAGADRMILVDLSGAVRSITITTGEVVWERELRVDVNRGPAVGKDVVVILDRGGTATALELSTGLDRWAVDLDGSDAVVLGNTVVTLLDQTVIGLDVVDGQRRWRRPIRGTYTQMVTVGDAVAVATKQQTLIVGESGQVRARRIEGFGLTSTTDRLIIWGQSSAEIVDANGSSLGRWEIPALSNVTDARPALAHAGGVLLFDYNWPFQRWSP